MIIITWNDRLNVWKEEGQVVSLELRYLSVYTVA